MSKTAILEPQRTRKANRGSTFKPVLPKQVKSDPKGPTPVLAGSLAETKPPAALIPERCQVSETVAIRLKYYRPAAREVFVAGVFNDWQPNVTRLLPIPDGEWVADLALMPGRYEYRFVVDGQWTDDPMADAYAANPFGELNSVILVECMT